MGWARHDDRRHSNPKLLRAGLAADGLHSRMTTYSSANETDGFVADVVMPTIGVDKGWEKALAALAREDLVDRDGIRGGWTVHDYLEFNPSHAELEEKRRKERERKAAQPRDTSGRIRSQRDSDSARIPHGRDAESESRHTVPIPSHPIPSNDSSNEESRATSKARRRTQVPKDFEITEAMKTWALENGHRWVDIQRETTTFLDHHRAKGSTFVDWIAAWRTWLNRTSQFKPSLVVTPAVSTGARIPLPPRTCGGCDSGFVVDENNEAVACPNGCLTAASA